MLVLQEYDLLPEGTYGFVKGGAIKHINYNKDLKKLEETTTGLCRIINSFRDV